MVSMETAASMAHFRKSPYRCRVTGIQLADLVKFMIAFCCGYAVRSAMEFSFQPDARRECPGCLDCPQQNFDQDILRQPQNFQLREPFKPKTMYEVLRYEYFNSSLSITNMDDIPKSGLAGHQKADIQEILSQTLAIFNSAKAQKWSLVKMKNGYRRFDPLRGEEYILDLVLSTKEASFPRTESHRFELVKPFGTSQLISNIPYDDNGKMIHFILPIADVNDKFHAFMANFEEVCLKNQEHVYLLIVSFVSEKASQESKKQVHNIAAQLTARYRKAHIRILQTTQPFSRAVGLDLGARQVPEETLMFFCDVDVKFTQGFLNRCRLNAAYKRSVYYPIVFAQYNPDIVRQYSPPEKVSGLEDINMLTGHWVHYGYGMACMYNLDYREVRGFDTNIHGWGGEDVDLYKKHVNSNLKIFRAMDPGLLHLYHDKHCPPHLTADQRRMCLGSQAEGYAAKSQLAMMVLKLSKDNLTTHK